MGDGGTLLSGEHLGSRVRGLVSPQAALRPQLSGSAPQGPLAGWASRSQAPEYLLPPHPQAGAEDGMSQAPGAQPSRPSVYHERQRLELCAVHALNNVLQQQLFSQEAADEICKRLAPDSRLNPHRSLLGTGNYDVNVIMAALQGLGLATVWWDRRRPLSQLALPQVLGLILNLPSPMSLGLLSLPLRRRHWVALRQVDGVYYNLDSKLRAPEALGGEDGVRAFLAGALAQGLCEVLLVVTKEVEEKGCWLRTD
uniref:Josephin-2 n=2 Tax=Panthera TaxID=9688 RepID=A0A8C8X553_PANLE